MMQLLISIAIAILIPLILRFYNSKTNVFELHNNIDFNDYFSNDYESARELFEANALKAGFDLSISGGMQPVNRSKLEPSLLDKKIDLTTSVAIRRGHPNKFLIHISGVHGPESYAGSAIQSHFLSHFSQKNLDVNESGNNLPTIVLIHALNPYGFATNRRVNEDNIDINRNILDLKHFEFVKSRNPNYAKYVDMDETMNPTWFPFHNVIVTKVCMLFMTIKSIILYGMLSIKTAMVAGNYHKATGFGFGGFEASTSALNLFKVTLDVLDIPNQASELVLIDVHTGLGESGVDTLLMEADDSNDDYLEAIFPIEYHTNQNATNKRFVLGGLKERALRSSNALHNTPTPTKKSPLLAGGYELTIGTTTHFCEGALAPRLHGPNKICVTQEFGTVGAITVGQVLIAENYAHHYGNAEEKAYFLSQLKDCFYVQTDEWKKRVLHRGEAVFYQALKKLSS